MSKITGAASISNTPAGMPLIAITCEGAGWLWSLGWEWLYGADPLLLVVSHPLQVPAWAVVDSSPTLYYRVNAVLRGSAVKVRSVFPNPIWLLSANSDHTGTGLIRFAFSNVDTLFDVFAL